MSYKISRPWTSVICFGLLLVVLTVLSVGNYILYVDWYHAFPKKTYESTPIAAYAIYKYGWSSWLLIPFLSSICCVLLWRRDATIHDIALFVLVALWTTTAFVCAVIMALYFTNQTFVF